MNKYEKALKDIFIGQNEQEAYEVLNEFVELLTPKKLKSSTFFDWVKSCPNCGHNNNLFQTKKYNHCPNCGQALDWSD